MSLPRGRLLYDAPDVLRTKEHGGIVKGTPEYAAAIDRVHRAMGVNGYPKQRVKPWSLNHGKRPKEDIYIYD